MFRSLGGVSHVNMFLDYVNCKHDKRHFTSEVGVNNVYFYFFILDLIMITLPLKSLRTKIYFHGSWFKLVFYL